MEPKPVSYSRLETRLRPQPCEMNHYGVMHGGMIMYHLDMACGMSAMRHTGTRAVTVSVDRMDFKSPIYPGENLLYKTSVNMVHKSSLEVGARLEAENSRTGELRHVGTAYLTFVALNENGRPTQIRPLETETEDDRRRMADAVRRTYLRRMERAHAKGMSFSFALELLPERFLMCRIDAGEAFPALPPGMFAMCVVTDTETTLVLPEGPGAKATVNAEPNAVPNAVTDALCAAKGARLEKGWRAFAVREQLDLTLSGVAANLSAILAAEKIPMQYVSTFGSGYILVRGDAVAAAAEALRLAGHTVTGQ